MTGHSGADIKEHREGAKRTMRPVWTVEKPAISAGHSLCGLIALFAGFSLE